MLLSDNNIEKHRFLNIETRFGFRRKVQSTINLSHAEQTLGRRHASVSGNR
jgi:hypothetical protein